MKTSNERKNRMREISEDELDLVQGGKITQENGGGQTPGGNAFGVPSENPAGNEPPGQNKGPPPA
jgi:hypothetical protein